MYAKHFGLRTLPFENVPDPAFFFDAGEYHHVLRRLTDAVAAGRGLMVVAGPIGSGKTTLSQKLMADLPTDIVHLWLPEPSVADREILLLLLKRFGCTIEWGSRVLALVALRDRLMENHHKGGRCLLVIDESHKMTDEGLETIRLLNNLEEGASKLIQILMLGQEELTSLLKQAGRESFRQRIANFEVLGCMKRAQVRDYVHHRLRVAGGDPAIIPDVLIEAVAEGAGGIPRLTNSLCDRALLYAFENHRPAVDSPDVLRAAEDVGLYRNVFHFLSARGIVKTIWTTKTLVETSASATPIDASLQPNAPGSIMALESAVPMTQSQTLPAQQNSSIEPGVEVGQRFAIEGMRFAEEQSAAVTPQPLTGALMFLAMSIAALGASLIYYCFQAFPFYGNDCLSHLLDDIVRMFGNHPI